MELCVGVDPGMYAEPGDALGAGDVASAVITSVHGTEIFGEYFDVVIEGPGLGLVWVLFEVNPA